MQAEERWPGITGQQREAAAQEGLRKSNTKCTGKVNSCAKGEWGCCCCSCIMSLLERWRYQWSPTGVSWQWQVRATSFEGCCRGVHLLFMVAATEFDTKFSRRLIEVSRLHIPRKFKASPVILLWPQLRYVQNQQTVTRFISSGTSVGYVHKCLGASHWRCSKFVMHQSCRKPST